MILELISIILGGMTIGSALMVILSKHPIRSVLYLVITFFFISGHFILMNAQFIAIVNIIVYAGAIMVLFLFVLMLLNLNKVDERKTNHPISFTAVIAGGLAFSNNEKRQSAKAENRINAIQAGFAQWENFTLSNTPEESKKGVTDISKYYSGLQKTS
jgi:NADH:ubiquinone oxidoreductase subunit 6 (subunit J)